MKKLLLGATIVLGAIFSTQAQTTILSTTFGSSIPAGWTQQVTTVDGGWKFGTSFGSNMQSYAPAQGDDAYVDDWDNNSSDVAGRDTLKTSIMNCAAYTNVFLTMNYMFWVDDGNETSNIIISINGGASWTALAALANTDGGWENGTIWDISAAAGGQSSVMIGFTYFNGYPSSSPYTAVGMAIENLDIYSPANYNVQVATQNLAPLMQVGTAYIFSGTSNNLGGDAVTSMQLNYSVNNGTPVTQTISSIAGFGALTSYNWTMSAVPFTPPTAGTYTVKYWANPLNSSNTNTNTDTLVATFWAIDSVVPRTALYEECTGQSCVFCMLAAPNMDSVYNNNASTTSIIRYHVPIPARDLMYGANETPSDTRIAYYLGSSQYAPYGALDGTTLNPSGYGNPPANQRYSSQTLQADNEVGSPLTIKITSAGYDAATDSFYVSTDITAYAALPAGLTAQVALTIDSITYTYDLSMDDPQQSFAAPVGTGASGYSYTDCPDYFYDYVLKFTHVNEEMFPNSGAGTSLSAFTVGQTQTLSFGWKKNHTWAQVPRGDAHYKDSTVYDSSATGQFVVFVQTNSGIAADGIPAKYVFQSAHASVTGITTVGMQEISNGVYFEMYPNPTNNNTNLAFKLDKDQNVNIELYNMLGEKVSTINEGSMSAGDHIVMINGSNLQNGVYFVRVNTDNTTTTKKLIIQR